LFKFRLPIKEDLKPMSGLKIMNNIESCMREIIKDQLNDTFSNISPLRGDASKKLVEGISFMKSEWAESLTSLRHVYNSEIITSGVENIKNFGSEISKVSHNVVGPLLSSNEVYSSMLEYFGKFHNHVSESPAVTKVMDGLAHAKGYGGAAFHLFTQVPSMIIFSVKERKLSSVRYWLVIPVISPFWHWLTSDL